MFARSPQGYDKPTQRLTLHWVTSLAARIRRRRRSPPCPRTLPLSMLRHRSSAALQLAQAQREAVRMAWDLSVLKAYRSRDWSASALRSARMAEGFRTQQEALVKGQVETDLAMRKLRRGAAAEPRRGPPRCGSGTQTCSARSPRYAAPPPSRSAMFEPKTPLNAQRRPRSRAHAALASAAGLKEDPDASRGSRTGGARACA